jgi:hypothetical protein
MIRKLLQGLSFHTKQKSYALTIGFCFLFLGANAEPVPKEGTMGDTEKLAFMQNVLDADLLAELKMAKSKYDFENYKDK